jgi:hypothetical protein
VTSTSDNTIRQPGGHHEVGARMCAGMQLRNPQIESPSFR